MSLEWSTWIGFGGLVVGVLGLVVGSWALRPKRLRWVVDDPVWLLQSGVANNPALTIMAGDVQLEDPYVVRAWLRNVGWRPIEPEDVHSHLTTIPLNPRARVIAASVWHSDGALDQPRIVGDHIEWDGRPLINRGEQVEFSMVCEGNPETFTPPHWRLAGTKIVLGGPSVLTVVTMLTVGLIAGLAGSQLTPTEDPSPTQLVITAVFLLAGGIFFWIVGILRQSHKAMLSTSRAIALNLASRRIARRMRKAQRP